MSMTENEAINILKLHEPFAYKEVQNAVGMAIKALEKQMPEKPYMIAMDGFGFEDAAHLCCPNCKKSVINYWNKSVNPNYCMMCGQKLKWK